MLLTEPTSSLHIIDIFIQRDESLIRANIVYETVHFSQCWSTHGYLLFPEKLGDSPASKLYCTFIPKVTVEPRLRRTAQLCSVGFPTPKYCSRFLHFFSNLTPECLSFSMIFGCLPQCPRFFGPRISPLDSRKFLR